eukprot:TRINITY_DN1337_c0_g1_i3.p1 TRINITY_DN1337_c0_g1~~TRINITY_DN1337_c0_g1_i3.p1  ORF type:complete len:303 (+),score=48.81 TRINITY_DN1337_c0_g1_i3:347-1255(+)
MLWLQYLLNSPRVWPLLGTNLSLYFLIFSYAVLRYDKRGCVKESRVAGCSYELCPLDGSSDDGSCVNLPKLSVNDFVTDASNAVKYLQRNWPSIDPHDITLIGHSQGCSVVPYVAKQVSGVKRIIQLAGIGVPIDRVIEEQLSNSNHSYTIGINICKATNGSTEVLKYLEEVVFLSQQAYQGSTKIFPLIKAGVLNRSEIVMDAPVGFWEDWLHWAEFDELYRTMSALATTGVKVLSVNSPSDLQVWPQFYQPLHAFVLPLPDSKIEIIPGLTHILTPSSFTTNQIDERVWTAILSFMQREK